MEICASPATYPSGEDMVSTDPDNWTHDIVHLRLQRRVEDERVGAPTPVMEPNEYYGYSADKGPDILTFKLMDDANAMLANFTSGDLQFIEDMPVDEIPALLASDELKIVDYIGTYYVCYQVQKAPLTIPESAKAFTLAIDSQYIVEKVTQTGQVLQLALCPPASMTLLPTATTSAPPAATTGLPPPDRREYTRRTVRRPVSSWPTPAIPTARASPSSPICTTPPTHHKAVGEALQQHVADRPGRHRGSPEQDWNVFLETRKRGEYHIARNGWIADYNDPISFLDMWYTDGGNNDAQYSCRV